MKELGRRSNEVRSRRAEIRKLVRAGDLRIAEVIRDPEPAMERVLLVDVIRWRLANAGRRKDLGTRFERVGRRAVNARVNLLARLERLPPSTLRWVEAEEALGTFRRRGELD